MAPGSTWYPVSMSWFKKFEEYTAAGDAQAPHPGQVDNSGIQDTKFIKSLKRGITEKKDFVWISSDGWSELMRAFKGGPAFPRAVEDDGMGQPKVSMYPQPCSLCVCSKSTKGAPLTKNGLVSDTTFLAARNLAVDKLLDYAKYEAVAASLLKRGQQDLDITYFRLWAREQEDEVQSKDDEDATRTDPTAVGAEGKPEPSSEHKPEAKSEEDEDEEEDEAKYTPPRPWRLLPRSEATLEEIAGNDASTELMLEVFDSGTLWPRGTSVQPGRCGATAWDKPDWDEVQFRKDLEKGTRIDAMDVDASWLEAEVVDVIAQADIQARISAIGPDKSHPLRKATAVPESDAVLEHCGARGKGALRGLDNRGDLIRVHFRAWGSNFDEWYQRSSWRMQPAWSRIRNFRDFAVGNRLVFMKTAANKTRQWYDGKVTVVNKDTQTVTVKAIQEKDPMVGMRDHLFGFDSPDITHIGVHNSYSLAKATPTGIKEASKFVGTAAGAMTSSTLYNPGNRSSTALTSYGTSSSSSSYSYGGGGGWRSSREGRPDEPGAVGLMNLGNTCFMNSMLQCLSNTEPLTRYFLDDLYESEINEENFLGHGGKLATAYAHFLKEVWSGRFTVVAPQRLKAYISEKAPQFKGYQQHDSQELMNFLLDGLHEDLNRVKKKPATDKVESDGRPDSVIGAIAWDTYLQRNNSVIADTFGGYLRSHVKCNEPGCGKVSITFDPFLSVSVPIPASKPRDIIFTFVPYRGPTLRYKCSLASDGSFMNLRDVLVQLEHWHPCDPDAPPLNPNELQWTKVAEWGNHFVDLCYDTTPLSDIKGTDWIFAYHVPRDATSPHGSRTYPYEIPEKTEGEKEGSEAGEGKPEPEGGSDDPEGDGAGDSSKPKAAGGIDSPQPLARSSSRTDPDESGGAGGSGEQPLALHHLLLPVNMFQPGYAGIVKDYGHPEVLSRAVASTLPTDAPAPAVEVFKKTAAKLAVGAGEDEPVKEGEVPGVTSRQVHLELYRKLVPKFAKDREALAKLEEEGTIGPANPPFTVKIAPVKRKYRVIRDDECTELEPESEDPVVLEADQVIRVEWDPEKAGGSLDWLQPSELYKGGGALDAIIHKESYEAARKKEIKRLDIVDCFDAFTVREQLGESDTWYCPRCKEHRQAYKKFDLWTIPEVLVVHLKRFKYTVFSSSYSASAYRDKLNNLVEFPIAELDLTPYVKGPQPGPHVYELYAVSEHSGGLGGGHYTAVGRNFRNKKWYDFNDSSVHGTDAKSAVSSRAYVLFYRRKDRVRMRPLLPEDVNKDGTVTEAAFKRLRGSASLYGKPAGVAGGEPGDAPDGGAAAAAASKEGIAAAGGCDDEKAEGGAEEEEAGEELKEKLS